MVGGLNTFHHHSLFPARFQFPAPYVCMSRSPDANVEQRDALKNRQWYLYGAVADGENFQEIAINKPEFRVGRRFGSDLELMWATVSGNHAEFITSDDQSLRLRDLDSTNGTFVNGNRIEDEVSLQMGDIVQLGASEFRVYLHSPIKSKIPQTLNFNFLPSQLVVLESLINGTDLIPYYQPVVKLIDSGVIGYEILARSNNTELSTPFQMFDIAEKLSLSSALSEACRTVGMQKAVDAPKNQILFFNTHPSELLGNGLVTSLEILRKHAPDQAMTLEIHEAAVTNLKAMAELHAQLKDLQIGLAYDDFGAGQARILDLIEVPPDILKFDISLIRDIDHRSQKHLIMVKTLVTMVRDFGISPLAEGIETDAEAKTCQEVGFELAQGYHFGRPAPEFNPD